MRACVICGASIPSTARADVVTCSGACRTAASRRRPPVELRELDRWVRWTEAKVPIRADGRGAAKVNDPATWASYRAAITSRCGIGAGFVLNGDGIACVDLDGCLASGRLTADGASLLEGCPSTWIEVSPSGRGLHVWGRADVAGRGIGEKGRCEVYGDGRYITVSGQRFRGSPARLADLTEWIGSLP